LKEGCDFICGDGVIWRSDEDPVWDEAILQAGGGQWICCG